MILDWEAYFPTVIAERGYDYYLQGLVTDLQQTKTQITATVTGTKCYDVSISMSNDEFQAGTCDCPYAAGHQYCKHMAAVLYQVAAVNDSSQPAKTTDSNEDDHDENRVAQVVAHATNAQVRDFLNTVLMHDAHLAQLFKLMVGGLEPQRDLSEYLAAIDDLFETNADSDGFIDYTAATDFGEEMLSLLNEEVQPLVDQRQFSLVFQILAHLMLKIDQVDIDDSDGEIMTIMSACDDLWQQVLAEANTDVQQQVFDWLCHQLTLSSNFIEDALMTLLFTYFKTPAFIDAKLAYTAKQLRAAEKRPNGWERDFQVEKWLKYHLQMMAAAHVPDQQVIEFCETNLTVPRVRLFYAQFCLQHQDAAQAVHLLQTGKKLVTDDASLLVAFSQQLKSVYQQQGNQKLYRQELWQLLTEYCPADETLFSELKQSYAPKDWPAARTQLFAAIATNPRADLKPLYVQENLLRPLLKAVVAADGLWDVRSYEGLLKPHFSDQLLAKYDQEVRKMAATTGTRRKYQQLVDILERMLNYPAGKGTVHAIVRDWRQQYPRRSAMMDELSRLK